MGGDGLVVVALVAKAERVCVRLGQKVDSGASVHAHNLERAEPSDLSSRVLGFPVGLEVLLRQHHPQSRRTRHGALVPLSYVSWQR